MQQSRSGFSWIPRSHWVSTNWKTWGVENRSRAFLTEYKWIHWASSWNECLHEFPSNRVVRQFQFRAWYATPEGVPGFEYGPSQQVPATDVMWRPKRGGIQSWGRSKFTKRMLKFQDGGWITWHPELGMNLKSSPAEWGIAYLKRTLCVPEVG